jgi:hypothetical protein
MQLVADGIISKADLGDLPVTRHIIPEYELIREFAEWYRENHPREWSETRDEFGGVITNYVLTYDHAKRFLEYRNERQLQVKGFFNSESGQPHTEIPSYSLTPEVKKVLTECVLPIWKSEVLENTTDDDFLKAITTANFSAYYREGKRQKVGYFIYSLIEIMGERWGNDVVCRLNDTKASLRTFQQHGTINKLKDAMKGFATVYNAGKKYKIDTKTEYKEKSGRPYHKAY